MGRTDFEVVRHERWTRKEPRKPHVHWDCQVTRNVTVSNLNVLNFRGWRREQYSVGGELLVFRSLKASELLSHLSMFRQVACRFFTHHN